MSLLLKFLTYKSFIRLKELKVSKSVLQYRVIPPKEFLNFEIDNSFKLGFEKALIYYSADEHPLRVELVIETLKDVCNCDVEHLIGIRILILTNNKCSKTEIMNWLYEGMQLFIWPGNDNLDGPLAILTKLNQETKFRT